LNAQFGRNLLVGLVLAGAAVVAAAHGAAPIGQTAGPSFRCSAPLLQTEATICGDAELRALDRAMAWLWESGRASSGNKREEQRLWLAQRDTCGANKVCLRSRYQTWLEDRNLDHGFGPSFEFRVDGNAAGLGRSAQLTVRPLGDGWIFFYATAVNLYDPHDGRGANMSDSGAVGVVHLTGGIGTWISEPDSPGSCRLQFVRLPGDRWRVVESGFGCSGLGSTLAGLYRGKR
jgi:hypothetical protein